MFLWIIWEFFVWLTVAYNSEWVFMYVRIHSMCQCDPVQYSSIIQLFSNNSLHLLKAEACLVAHKSSAFCLDVHSNLIVTEERWARQCCISLSVHILLFAQGNDAILPYMDFGGVWIHKAWKVATLPNEDRDADRQTCRYNKYFAKADTLTNTCKNTSSTHKSFTLHTLVSCN